MSANIPANFSGELFKEKYSLSDGDFKTIHGTIVCPALPGLTTEDLLDCIVDMEKFARINDRRDNAKVNAKAIPNWAGWDEDQATSYIDSNVTDLASAKTVLKAMARMIIALRDSKWPDLPED